MNTKYAWILTLLFSTALTGCSIARGNRIDETAVSAIQRNVTTEAQIRAAFGEPVAVEILPGSGIKILSYRYHNDENIQKTAASVGGMVVGGLLGNRIGNGGGRALATAVGAMAGSSLGENSVTAREENRRLDVIISLATGRVRNYRYRTDKKRSQSWYPGSGVAPL